jgi:hypothetical protein
MATQQRKTFVGSTLKFCIAGFFVGGFTVIIILGLQQGLERLGVKCPTTWTVLWIITGLGSICGPLVFYRYLEKKIAAEADIPSGALWVFNFIEYTFIQCSLGAIFTSGKTLCYSTDGQSGLEFIFTAWMALPLLILLSWWFDTLYE